MDNVTVAICNIAKRVEACSGTYPWLGEAVVDWLAIPVVTNVIKLSYAYTSLMAILPPNKNFHAVELDDAIATDIRDTTGEFIIHLDSRLTEYERMFGPSKHAVFPGSHADWYAEIGSQVMLLKTFVPACISKMMHPGKEKNIVAMLANDYSQYRTSEDWFNRGGLDGTFTDS